MEIYRKFLALCFLISLLEVVAATDMSLLLIDDDVPANAKATECVFDNQRYELGTEWIPDLGSPIGVLYCMRCKCVPFQKKQRIFARVQCHSIKELCPTPKCEKPILLPDRCCKTCHEDLSPDTAQDILPQNIVEIEEKSEKHFVSLLTARTSLNAISINKTNIVANARFVFNQNNLYYSIYFSEKAVKPESIQFMNKEGIILEEFFISNHTNSFYQNQSRKICGVWRRLAKDYKKLLRQEKLYVGLIWGAKGKEQLSLSGQIKKNDALETELLSALLEPTSLSNNMVGAGGTAMISAIKNSTTKIVLVFNGIFMPSEIANVSIKISLLMKRQIVFEKVIQILKPATDFNIIELNAKISENYSGYLTKGDILLNIASLSKPNELKLSGNIITRATCEIFQTTLASSDPGMSWLYLNNAGSLIYNIQIDQKIHPIITLVDANSKIEDVNLPLAFQKDGWANGSFDEVTPKFLQSLYAGNLTINVATSIQNNSIRGRLIAMSMDEARDSSAPVLLKKENSLETHDSVGMAWISVGSDCYLHYDVSINGLDSDRKLELWIELYPVIAPGAPFISRQLNTFQGTSVEGSPIEILSKGELSLLESGVNYLIVKDSSSKMVLLTAKIVNVSIPSSCKPYISLESSILLDDEPEIVSPVKCYHEGKFYENEETWISSNNSCETCFCQNGRPKCDSMTCPEINCSFGKISVVKGECCPICVNNSMTTSINGKKCILNGKSYLPGSKFHPFLLPIGFDVCTECYCNPQDFQIKCFRLRNNEKCNKKRFYFNDPFSDDLVDLPVNYVKNHTQNNVAKVLAEGGCKNPINSKKPFPNGSNYHPYIDSLGEYQCVTCKCQNGTAQCNRQHCDMSMCQKWFANRRKKVNPSEFCCSLKDCKKLRHKKKALMNS